MVRQNSDLLSNRRHVRYTRLDLCPWNSARRLWFPIACSETHHHTGADAEVVLVIVAAVVGGGDDALSTGSALFGSDSLSIAVG